MSQQQKVIGYQWGEFTLWLDRRELWSGKRPLPLPARAHDILACLAAQAGSVVSSENLFRASAKSHETTYLPHIVINGIAAIRRAIGHKQIATASGKGYQLTERAKPLYDAPAKAIALPRRLNAMFGRDDDRQAACAALLAHHLVELTGTSGVGKSTLATDIGWTLEASSDIGRIVLIDLSALTDSASVIAVTAAALGITLRRADAEIETITAALTGPTLLIFDGCDQVIDGVRSLIEALLTRVRKLYVLTTSQSRLHIAGETVIRLDPLSLDTAADLLISRVTMLDRHFQVDTNDERLRSICRHLDGIPAAIEGAAANVLLLGLDGVAQALDRQVDLRHAGSPLARHGSSRAMATWTYGLLANTDQQIFRSIAAIPVTFDLAAAVAVIGPNAPDQAGTIEALGRLAEKCLIVPVAGTQRYRLLEGSRLLGSELRRLAGEDDAVMTRLASHMIDLGHAAEVEWEHAQQEPFLQKYRPELDNLIPVLDWALAEQRRAPIAIRLAGACGRFFNHYGQFTSGRDYLGRAAALVDESTSVQDAALVLRRAGGIWHTTDRSLALHYLNGSESLYRQCGDQIGLARTLSLIGDCLTFLGNHETAQSIIEEAVGIIEPTEQYKSRIGLLFQLGRTHHMQRHFADAERTYTKALELARRLKDVLRENLTLINIAEARANQDRRREAIDLISKAVTTLRQSPYRAELGHALVNLASYKMLNGEDSRAETEEALPLTFEEGSYWLLSELQLCALISAREGRLHDAATMAAYVDIGFTRSGDQRQPLEIEIRDRLQQLIGGTDGDTALVALWTENEAVEFCQRHLISRPGTLTEAAD